ncbi:hypothetical protein SKAU_G00152360 [Synaphobranchus kaupii]|uniref:Uncharacterized protein n=1 Tax=Synaphobranchus kaupii TaxID=118154 RepID=A0A9Q1IY10_SYNKA|nr:hypothetical protein SKAU_G00152360 [Synaphobranchus kaupii]
MSCHKTSRQERRTHQIDMCKSSASISFGGNAGGARGRILRWQGGGHKAGGHQRSPVTAPPPSAGESYHTRPTPGVGRKQPLALKTHMHGGAAKHPGVLSERLRPCPSRWARLLPFLRQEQAGSAVNRPNLSESPYATLECSSRARRPPSCDPTAVKCPGESRVQYSVSCPGLLSRPPSANPRHRSVAEQQRSSRAAAKS